MKRSAVILFFLATIIYVACREPFDANIPNDDLSYLVVEGWINTAGVTNISITRTQTLKEKLGKKGELKAAVQVEGETSGVFPLAEKGSGLYSVAQLNLNPAQKYRLRIKTLGNRTYLSDYITVKNNPPIDSISWERTPEGVEIYANTHDPKKETRYYMWDYEEDWELRSNNYSEHKVVTGNVRGATLSIEKRPRAEQELMYTCYRNTKSSTIPIFSSKKLEDDIVYKFPLQSIPNGSDKFEVKYTMLVKQYALSAEAFEYLDLMRKNTESAGSLFDSQPTELKGNVHNIADPNEIVIGFVQAGPVLEKRIYIMPAQVPTWKVNLECDIIESTTNYIDLSNYFLTDDTGPYIPTSLRGSFLGGASRLCMDCRLRGGNNIKPVFW